MASTTLNNFGNYAISDSSGRPTPLFRSFLQTLIARTGGSVTNLVITDIDGSVTNLTAQLAEAEDLGASQPVSVFLNPAPNTEPV